VSDKQYVPYRKRGKEESRTKKWRQEKKIKQEKACGKRGKTQWQS
jgi:hypothetical protein